MASEGTAQSGLAARYAAALFELASERKQLDQTAEELNRVRKVLAESADLNRVIGNPAIARDVQAKAMNAVLDKLGVGDLTRNFIGLVGQKRRLAALGAMADAFQAALAAQRGEVIADVVVAKPLEAGQETALAGAITKALGSKASYRVKVDAALLGGMIVRVGSRMIDHSLRTKITRLQLAMKAPGGAI